jgi:excisionase family DNA binding protein
MSRPQALAKSASKTVPKYEDFPDLVTPEEAGAFLRISRNTTYELLRTQQLPHIKFGRLIRIRKATLVGEGE